MNNNLLSIYRQKLNEAISKPTGVVPDGVIMFNDQFIVKEDCIITNKKLIEAAELLKNHCHLINGVCGECIFSKKHKSGDFYFCNLEHRQPHEYEIPQ